MASEETGGAPLGVLVNVDVPDLAAGRTFYESGLGFAFRRTLFEGRAAELSGGGVRLFLIEAAAGPFASGVVRDYERHWTPAHLDLVVADLPAAIARATAAGARQERPVARNAVYELAPMADPFGHGFCLMRFLGADYDPVADA